MPDFALSEIAKYEERIVKRTKLKDDFSIFTRKLFTYTTVIPKIAISLDSTVRAYELCKDVDPKDTAFVALSIELSVPLWTNDKKLIDGLRAKEYTQIADSAEIFDRFS